MILLPGLIGVLLFLLYLPLLVVLPCLWWQWFVQSRAGMGEYRYGMALMYFLFLILPAGVCRLVERWVRQRRERAIAEEFVRQFEGRQSGPPTSAPPSAINRS